MANQTPQPPRDPPPSYCASVKHTEMNPPPYHNWQEAVPDTATFPPPPVTGFYSSNAGNASSYDAERAHDFCDRTPLWTPVKPSAAVYSQVNMHDFRPVQPRELHGGISSISQGIWRGFSQDTNGDCLILTSLPLYFPVEDSPFTTERSKTIYFEIKLLSIGIGPAGTGDSSGVSIGFVAQPYPSWRSPGWERGSLGVFSDDGCRFVNDSWGGKDFTTEFKVGETIGLGMTFSLPDNVSTVSGNEPKKPKVDVFCTRNGQKAGGWDLNEETDGESGGVEGLEGDFDLYGAVGLFGGVEFEVCFDPKNWLWKRE
ncbi:hypothetical protein ASPWEDRAFT_173747 [Aspergillus wentii DTO 134E9]|uniref:SPRY domain-containing protein n=1 Tax=Aspergillus wentii DTO 134E9 TaxID=1073089 RepID=A0A1L9RHL0_ASPWE|nr:uncharacterized protein ASPWEDRAFT_173747 [Aspergillus wentii DTO 134E9]KAI9923445.1 hypothetical protein MW887_009306 [Aspergillus wentii]OJJ34323.1 hypothetical protein ASPWEDRAFT_173747 [Aspergillus wentii DTO 134E9]